MESNRRGGPPPIPGFARTRPSVGGLSFERGQRAPVPQPTFQHSERITPPSTESTGFDYEAPLEVKPRELFDPKKNPEHAKWLKEKLDEVRGANFSMAAFYFSVALASGWTSFLMTKDTHELAFAAAGSLIEIGFATLAGIEIRNALAKRKMGLSDKE